VRRVYVIFFGLFDFDVSGIGERLVGEPR